MLRKTIQVILVISLSVITSYASDKSTYTIEKSSAFQPENSDYIIQRGEIDLPSIGHWQIVEPEKKDLFRVFMGKERASRLPDSRRLQSIQNNQKNQKGCGYLRRVYQPVKEYAVCP